MGKQIPLEAAKQIADYVIAGQNINAIKLYREHSGQGLKASKDFVDALEAELRTKEPGKFAARPAGNGCLGMVAACGISALFMRVAVLVLLT
ncbi:MAG TPA: hypothetical protein DCS43_09645 [Verrucomicrobia bacterium]|nr:hypothetical protein [Verrucomicrobiota bacterium]